MHFFQIYEEEIFEETYETAPIADAGESVKRWGAQQGAAFATNYQAFAFEYKHYYGESNQDVGAKNEQHIQEICCNEEQSLSYKTEEDAENVARNLIGLERERQWRWESDQIDYNGEDRFELIQKYLDNSLMELAASEMTMPMSIPLEEEEKEEKEEEEVVGSSISEILSPSVSNFDYPEHVREVNSRASQTCTVFVSKAVQTDFEEIFI